MKRKHGFTLIELIVVMAILAILMAIGAGSFTSSMKKGRDSTRKANLRAITNALEMYYNDKVTYPVGANGTFSNCYITLTETVSGPCGKDYPVFRDSPTTGAMYMGKFPVDPVASQKYYYVSNGKQFQIYAHLENNQDPQCLQTDCPSNGLSCGTNVGCNYGVSSANTNP